MSFFSVSSISLRLRRSFLLALAFSAVLVLGTAGQAHAQFTVTRTSAADFFIEQGVATQNCSYVSYLVTNTGATPQSDVWVRIGNFGGGVISLGGGQSNKFPIGTINNGASKAAFFYLTASGSRALRRHTTSPSSWATRTTGACSKQHLPSPSPPCKTPSRRPPTRSQAAA